MDSMAKPCLNFSKRTPELYANRRMMTPHYQSPRLVRDALPATGQYCTDAHEWPIAALTSLCVLTYSGQDAMMNCHHHDWESMVIDQKAYVSVAAHDTKQNPQRHVPAGKSAAQQGALLPNCGFGTSNLYNQVS